MNGLYETLAHVKAKGLRIGIITNGSCAVQEPKIDLLGIRPLMDVVIVSESVQIQKPDRRIFRRCLDALSLQPSEAAYVGDHPINDVLGAASAGMSAIWLKGRHRWPAGHPRPRLHISELNDLISLLDRL